MKYTHFENGRYRKRDPEYMRRKSTRHNPRHNAISAITYKEAGGYKLYFALPKDERLRYRAMATKQYDQENLKDLIYNIAPPRNWTRTKRTLPKVDRPKSIRVTTKKVVDFRGYVYIFKDHMKSDGLYKIGASHAPQERLDQANTWGDFESIYESEEVADCAKLEKEVHQSLRKYQAKGEWFKITKDIAINTIQELVDAAQEQEMGEARVS